MTTMTIAREPVTEATHARPQGRLPRTWIHRALPVEPVAVLEATVEASDVPDVVDVWGLDSFPASDPPANW